MAPWPNSDFLTPSFGGSYYRGRGGGSHHRGERGRGRGGGSRSLWGHGGDGTTKRGFNNHHHHHHNSNNDVVFGVHNNGSNDERNPFSIDVVSEKFDELEVIEDSNELAKQFNMVTPQNNNNMIINFDAYDDIPVEVSGDNVPKPANSFAEIDLGKALNDNIKRCKYVKPTPIQRHAIPIAIKGRDLMACAQTGSGKTAAFCFPIIAGILKRVPPYRPPLSRGGVGEGGVGGSRMVCPVALIMSPTRELSSQIHDEAKKFAYQTGVKVAVAYGGTPMGDQLRILAKGVDILVATPGRLVDMIERGKVSLRMIRYLALDEADRMLDMGFEPQIRKIVQQMDMPRSGLRQTMLFSATFPTEIQRLASDFLKDYIFLTVGKVGSSTDLIEQKVEYVEDYNKRQHLKDLLMSQRMNGTHGKNALTIVFLETKRGVDDLELWLSRNGFPATAIHGDKVQWERERALKSFKSGATPIIVATDVAARGLDIPSVAHVINFDLPRDIADYVHRIGRTGRAGKSGLATAFFNDKNISISKALIEIMEDSHQAIPSWLAEYADSPSSFGYGGSSGSRHSRGGGKFSGRDYRNFNQASTGYSGYSDHSNSYADEVPRDEPFVGNGYTGVRGAEVFGDATFAANNSYIPSYDYTLGYEHIVPSGWD